MAERMPDDRSHAKHVAIAVTAAVVGAVLFGVGLWMATHPGTEKSAKQTEIEPAEPSVAATLPGDSGSAAESASAEASPGAADGGTTGDGAGTGTGTGTQAAVIRAARVAFRLGASVYVANEDGSGAERIVHSADGPYALSPDGTVLALVDGSTLRLVDVASKESVDVGQAEVGFVPRWSADSSALVYRRHKDRNSDAYEIWRVGRDGKNASKLTDGERAAYSPTGNTLVILDRSADGSSAFVKVSVDGGPLRPVNVAGGTPTAVGSNGERIFVGLTDGQRGNVVVSLAKDGTGQTPVAGAVPGDMPAIWSEIQPSTDSALLALEAQGDDGYSRCFIVPIGGGELIALSARRDGALHGWSADATHLFLIDGNAFQGQPTSLVSLKRDGSARRDVVTGAE